MSTSGKSLRTRLAEELRAEMARQGMSHRALADLIGRPHNTVSHQLNGESAIDPDVLESMCNALGMETLDLYAAARRNGGWTVQMPPVRIRPMRVAGATHTPEVRTQDNHRYTRSPRPGFSPVAGVSPVRDRCFRFDGNLVADAAGAVA